MLKSLQSKTIELFKSLIRQELNSAGLILNATLNLSYSHCNKTIIDETFYRFQMAINKLSSYIKDKDLNKSLFGDIIKPTFHVRK